MNFLITSGTTSIPRLNSGISSIINEENNKRKKTQELCYQRLRPAEIGQRKTDYSLKKKNYNSKKEDNKEKDQREDERNVIL